MEPHKERSLLFLSDVHLTGRDDARQDYLVDFLEKNKDRFDTLVLVGDIFDFWIGYKYVVYAGYLPLISQLERLARCGKKIILYEGNHDFLLGSYFTDALKAEVYSGPAPLDLGKYKIWICHGDQLDSGDFIYKFFRWLLRSPLIKWSARFLHPDLLWILGNFASKRSRRRHKISEQRRATLLAYALARFDEGFNVVMAGHLHDPFLKVVLHNNENKAVISTGDWLEHRSVLWFKNGVFHLIPDIERNVSQRFPLRHSEGA